jgi:hypothetical protein
MAFIKLFTSGKRTIVTDKTKAMGSQSERVETLQPVMRETRSTYRTSTANLLRGDYCADEDKEVGAADQVSDGPPAQLCNGCPQRRTSSETQQSENTWEREHPCRHDLLDKADSQSVDVTNLQNVLAELQQCQNHILTLEKAMEDTQYETRQKDVELKIARRNWMEAASELGRSRSQGTGLYQFPDNDLTIMVTQLRCAIRNFSEKYFLEDSIPDQFGYPSTGGLWKYMPGNIPDSLDYLAHHSSKSKGPIAIQLFLWRVLVSEVFNKFCWVPRLNKSLAELCKYLPPGRHD